MSQKYQKLKTLLQELFQLDQPDLDFGLYRIMHAKSAEVTQFLEKDLLPQVKEAFGLYKSADKGELEKELAKAIEQAQALGADPETLPKVKDLRNRIASEAIDLGALENEVYDHLYTFFRRYYSEGDFLAKRVYKPGVYAIPYEGEEVTLHWANKDQYYIKTSEYLRDYSFRLRPDDHNPMCVHFRLADAKEGEHGNIVPAEGTDRVFALAPGGDSGHDFFTLQESDGCPQLFIAFEYRPSTLSDWPPELREDKSKPPSQKEMTIFAVQRILAVPDLATAQWTAALAAPHYTADGEKADYSRLEAHLRRYAARNTFDYFIHKDLGAFLRRELDFYIKNEVMHLDDVEDETASRVEQYLSKLRVIRRVATKLIAFLAQLEHFQKRLWLKKKFVVETNYCVTLDRIPAEFYPEVCANNDQREEWVRLFSINEIEGNLVDPRYEEPLSLDFLRRHKHLVLDTRFFSRDFVQKLVDALALNDDSLDGILVHSDNFQALSLMSRRLSSQVKCAYIDPPYNTTSSAILYKNDYKHSSFASMLYDRLNAIRTTLKQDGALFVSIDKTERMIVEHMLDEVFGADNHIEELIWTQNTANSQLPNYSTNHEYVEVYAKERHAVEADAAMFREPKPGYAEIMARVQELNASYPTAAVVEKAIKSLFKEHLEEFKDEIEASGREWDSEAQKQDPWKGIYNYCNAEYRDGDGNYVPQDEAQMRNAKLWIWREISPSAPAGKQSPTTKDPTHYNFRYYNPTHPTTNKPCPHPKGGWKFPLNPDPANPARRSFVELARDWRIAWGDDETKVPQTKGFLHEVETNIGTSVFYEYNDGESEVAAMFGRSGVFLSPKSSKFVRRFVAQATTKADYVLDAFGGSGSTAHAVISMNDEDQGKRKYCLIEAGHHFDSVLRPRILKAIYSRTWKDGKASIDQGRSHCLKYVRLESYEDTLNNLHLQRSPSQQALLVDTPDATGTDRLKEQYLLRYMLSVESHGSQSLLNIRAFCDPTNYLLNVKRPASDESQDVRVDLLETFNWLLGVAVKSIGMPQEFQAAFGRDSENRLHLQGKLKHHQGGPWWFRIVEGVTPQGHKTLIVWRKLTGDIEKDNLVLDVWMKDRLKISTKDFEFDLIYVNGDNNLENLKLPDDTWKVRLIEEDFHRLMFDSEGL